LRGEFLKKDLLNLIDQADHIRSYFHAVDGRINTIHDKAEFSTWKRELQFELEDIYNRTYDKFIWSTLTILDQGFNGWRDEKSYNDLHGSLLAIQKNIDRYYPSETDCVQNDMGGQTMSQKSPKIFISHASKDKNYVSCIVKLLEFIGLRQEQLFCSSVPGYGIPLDEDIYDYLRQQFQEYNLHVILVLSDNYYQSVACMNEMGAAWVLRNDYTTILLPGFEFKKIEGAINPRKIALKLDGDSDDVKEKLGQLKDKLLKEFGLLPLPEVRWEKQRDEFISVIAKGGESNPTISDNALKILQAACESDDGTIIKINTLSGTYIQANGQDFITSQERREIAKWESSLKELVDNGFIEAQGRKGEIYLVSQSGYDYIEQQKA
jgi:hypothetical protein